MKINVLSGLCAVFFVLSLLGAAEAPLKFQLPAIQNFAVEQEVAVAATGSVVRVSGGRNAEKEEPGKMAEALNDAGALWQWRPSPLVSHATGGADLTDAALSPDESTVVLVERVGGIDAPNSTRLIFVSMRSGSILRITELPQRRIAAVKWLSGGRLLLQQEAQPELNSPGAFLIFSLTSMTAAEESQPLNGRISKWSVGGGMIFFCMEGDKHFYRLALNDISGEPKKYLSRTDEPRPLWMPRCRLLAIYGGSDVEYYQPDQRGGFVLLRTLPLPHRFRPHTALEIGDNGDIALLASASAVGIVTSGVFRRIGRDAGEIICYSPEASVLLVEQRRFSSLLPCRIPEGSCGKAVAPGKLKPMNRNRNFRIFALKEKHPAVILIDHRANIFRIDMKSKRPVKRMIMETDRTGFR